MGYVRKRGDQKGTDKFTPWAKLDSQTRSAWQVAGEAAAATCHQWYEDQWANRQVRSL